MQCKLHTFLVIRSVENLFKIIFQASAASPDILAIYDAVSDVVESGVHWRSNFQIGSRVLKIVINLFLCISMSYNVIS